LPPPPPPPPPPASLPRSSDDSTGLRSDVDRVEHVTRPSCSSMSATLRPLVAGNGGNGGFDSRQIALTRRARIQREPPESEDERDMRERVERKK
jgi:hypothetical protein